MRIETVMVALGAVALLLAARPAPAHGVHTTHRSDQAVIVEFLHDDHTPMADVRCEVRGPGREQPFLAGRTDLLGRCVFRPDRAGTWVVRAWTEDGHGARVEVEVDGSMLAAAGAPPSTGRLQGVITGVAVIFGVFGLWSLFVARRRRA